MEIILVVTVFYQTSQDTYVNIGDFADFLYQKLLILVHIFEIITGVQFLRHSVVIFKISVHSL